MRAARIAAITLGCLSAAGVAPCQTTDPLFAHWRWAPQGIGSRPAGLSGAFVALADEVKTAYVNPAGLTLIPIHEVGVSTGGRWAGAAWSGRKLRAAAYAATVDDRRIELSGAAAGPGRPFLEADVWEAGIALGVAPFSRFRIGGALARTESSLRAERPRGSAAAASLSGSESRWRGSAGVLLDLIERGGRPLPSLRLGASYQRGFDWSSTLTVDTTASAVQLRRPSVFAAGLAWRLTHQWTFSAQADLIRYREVVETLRRNVGAAALGFELSDQVEPRLGAEFVWPLSCGCGVSKLRGGVHYRSAGVLTYRGADPSLAAAFPGALGRAVGSLGASFLAEYFGRALRFDVDSADLLEGPELSFGVVFRF
jgi:hypothetical protein